MFIITLAWLAVVITPLAIISALVFNHIVNKLGVTFDDQE